MDGSMFNGIVEGILLIGIIIGLLLSGVLLFGWWVFKHLTIGWI